MLHTDAGFQNSRNGGSQAGYVLGVTTDGLRSGEVAPWSPIAWRSHRLKRVVSSTLAAETQSMLNGLGHAEWLAAHFAELLHADFAVASRSQFMRSLQPQFMRQIRHSRDKYITLETNTSL